MSVRDEVQPLLEIGLHAADLARKKDRLPEIFGLAALPAQIEDRQLTTAAHGAAVVRLVLGALEQGLVPEMQRNVARAWFGVFHGNVNGLKYTERLDAAVARYNDESGTRSVEKKSFTHKNGYGRKVLDEIAALIEREAARCAKEARNAYAGKGATLIQRKAAPPEFEERNKGFQIVRSDAHAIFGKDRHPDSTVWEQWRLIHGEQPVTQYVLRTNSSNLASIVNESPETIDIDFVGVTARNSQLWRLRFAERRAGDELHWRIRKVWGEDIGFEPETYLAMSLGGARHVPFQGATFRATFTEQEPRWISRFLAAKGRLPNLRASDLKESAIQEGKSFVASTKDLDVNQTTGLFWSWD